MRVGLRAGRGACPRGRWSIVGKKSGPVDPIDKARRRLAKAQLKLHVAQEEHAQAREQGKQEIEQARLRAARWLAKSSEQVEKRAQKVADFEARLLALTDSKVSQSQDDAPDGLALMPPSPEAVADVIERLEENGASDDGNGGILLPETLDVVKRESGRGEPEEQSPQ